MDAELKTYLEGMEGRLGGRTDALAERLGGRIDTLDGRIEALGKRLDGRIDTLDGRIDVLGGRIDALGLHVTGQLEALELRMREHTETVETRLLSEFWKWARTSDARYRQNQGLVGALDGRVQAVEDRVADLERRKAS